MARRSKKERAELEAAAMRESMEAATESAETELLDGEDAAAAEAAAESDAAVTVAPAGFGPGSYDHIAGVEAGEVFRHEPEVVEAVGVDVARRDTEAVLAGESREVALTLPERQSIKQAKRRLTLARNKAALESAS